MRIPACDGFQETLLYCLDTLDVGSYLLETGLPKAATRLPGDLTSVLGQNEKYSERVDIFRSCTNNRHLGSGGKELFIPNPIFREYPFSSNLPRLPRDAFE